MEQTTNYNLNLPASVSYTHLDVYKRQIYDHCDILKDKKLHEAYGITDPLDIVEKVFNSNAEAIEQASKDIMKMYGYFRGKNEPNIVDELKN